MERASTHFGPYKVFQPRKGGILTYSKGKPVYELVGPDGAVYVMQAGSQVEDPGMTLGSLAKLGDRLKLAPGWTYRVRTLDKDLGVGPWQGSGCPRRIGRSQEHLQRASEHQEVKPAGAAGNRQTGPHERGLASYLASSDFLGGLPGEA